MAFIVSVCPYPASAQDRERGFVDLYLGATHLAKSDVPTWTFNDAVPVGGARVGF
jgi:Outer membrane protein beta-barrel domain